MGYFQDSYEDKSQRFWMEHFNRLVKKGHALEGAAEAADQCLALFKIRFPAPPTEEEKEREDIENYPYEVVDKYGNRCQKFKTWKEAVQFQKDRNNWRKGHKAVKRSALAERLHPDNSNHEDDENLFG
ncbi:MAG: hypothetical protein F6K48_03080 [Okeania sp. SIO3H1]|nr:hypothetical protein [Okeania sp. SIO3H1]